jgi:large subunit ribosomal protein L10
MALSQAKKSELAAKYEAEVSNVEHAFLVSLEGLTVNENSELRKRLREQGGRCLVVKNRILLKKISGKPLEQLRKEFVGPTAIAFGKDPVGLAKVLTAFAKEVPALKFKGGLVEGRAIAAGEVAAISELPSREQLTAKLLFLLQSPIVRLVRVLQAAGPQRLAQVLDLVSKKKQQVLG